MDDTASQSLLCRVTRLSRRCAGPQKTCREPVIPHIVHLETGRHLYGGAQQVLLLLDGLRGAGLDVTLVCPPDSAISTAAGGQGVRVCTLPMAGELDALFGLRFARWLAHEQADLVHVHSRRGADLWGGMGARQAGVPAVLSRRVDNAEVPLLGRAKYRCYERVIGISQAIVQQLRATGVPLTKLRCVPSAVDPVSVQPVWSRAQFRAAFGLDDTALAVITVAQLIPRKGHAVLLRAWPAVLRAVPQARLLLFGQGPLQAALERQVAALGVQDSVHFAGLRADLHHFLAHADVLVHPALQEGLGVCLLEAQAAGVPVVASRAGGIAEAVAPGTPLCVPDDPAALAAMLIPVLQDAGLRSQLAAAGRAHVAAKFSPAAMVSGNLDVYRELSGMTGVTAR